MTARTEPNHANQTSALTSAAIANPFVDGVGRTNRSGAGGAAGAGADGVTSAVSGAELGAVARRVDGRKPLVELLGVEPALRRRGVQPLRGGLAVGVGGAESEVGRVAHGHP